jgi:hypothetical protein
VAWTLVPRTLIFDWYFWTSMGGAGAAAPIPMKFLWS